MRKTAMIELRDKLLEEIQNLKEASQANEHLKGYREALKNVANDIDAQMAKLEYKSIVNAHLAGQNSAEEENGETEIEYYKSVYGGLS